MRPATTARAALPSGSGPATKDPRATPTRGWPAAGRGASNEGPGGEPEVVRPCCGDTRTLETMAATRFLRENAPDLRVRVVNVVDLMTLFSPDEHPHGTREE